jgi:hypothetical protein
MTRVSSEYWASACAHKVRYRNRATADAARRKLNRKRDRGGTLEAYRCPVCHGFHLGPTDHRHKRLAAITRRPRHKTVRWDGWDSDDEQPLW